MGSPIIGTYIREPEHEKIFDEMCAEVRKDRIKRLISLIEENGSENLSSQAFEHGVEFSAKGKSVRLSYEDLVILHELVA